MKLWHKIFLLSLSFMVIAVEVTSYIILNKNFSMSISREQEQAVTRHESFSAGIANNLIYERLKSGQVLLSSGEITSVIEDITTSQLDADSGIAVYNNENMVSIYHAEIIEQSPDFRLLVQKSNSYLAMIGDSGEKTYAMVGSKMILEGRLYYLFTTTDITELYNNYDELMGFVQLISIVSAGVFAVILLILVVTTLKPLSTINATIHEIADGNYSLRLKKKGGQEFRELSANINTMSEAIEDKVERIQSLADGRKQFIDNLAHEMKTPLTSILGFADILRVKRTVGDRQRQEYAGVIVEETRRLKGLSGKLLELATTTSGLPLDYETIDAEELFGEMGRIFQPILKRKNLHLNCSVTHGTAVYADKELFQSLLYNLIDNAMKASGDGQEIRIDCSDSGSGTAVTVSDDGVGMSEEDVKKATRPFYMADKSRSRKDGGAGLGLALCAEIAGRHNADIDIKSSPGKGTAVSITLPAAEKEGEFE